MNKPGYKIIKSGENEYSVQLDCEYAHWDIITGLESREQAEIIMKWPVNRADLRTAQAEYAIRKSKEQGVEPTAEMLAEQESAYAEYLTERTKFYSR